VRIFREKVTSKYPIASIDPARRTQALRAPSFRLFWRKGGSQYAMNGVGGAGRRATCLYGGFTHAAGRERGESRMRGGKGEGDAAAGHSAAISPAIAGKWIAPTARWAVEKGCAKRTHTTSCASYYQNFFWARGAFFIWPNAVGPRTMGQFGTLASHRIVPCAGVDHHVPEKNTLL
jgi:hypothetical protein